MDSILIVDDERGIRETLRAVMEDEVSSPTPWRREKSV